MEVFPKFIEFVPVSHPLFRPFGPSLGTLDLLDLVWKFVQNFLNCFLNFVKNFGISFLFLDILLTFWVEIFLDFFFFKCFLNYFGETL